MAAKRNPVSVAFASALRDARRQGGITQEELAARTRYSVRFVSFLETGDRQPTISALIAFERALGLSPGELVRRTVALRSPGSRR